MNNILITGGSGYSGKNLYQYLSKKKINIKSLFYKKKIKKKHHLKLNLLKKIKLDYSFNWIVHTASHHKIIDFKKNPKLKFNNNIQMINNLINFALEKKIKNFIFYSTYDLNYTKKNNKKLFYIDSKIKCENLLISALKKGILKKLFILRLPAIIGKNSNKNFLADTLKKMKNNQKITIWNYNEKFNNIINIHDLNNFIYYLINLKVKKKILIIDCLCSGSIKLITLVKLMLNKIQSKSKIELISGIKKKNILILNKKIGYKFYSVKKAVLKFMGEFST